MGGRRQGFWGWKGSASFFEKKEAKKLFLLGGGVGVVTYAKSRGH
jgi:hypothetical protein